MSSSGARAAAAAVALIAMVPAVPAALSDLAPVGASSEHLVVALSAGFASQAVANELSRYGVALDHRLFRGHPDWNLWDARFTQIFNTTAAAVASRLDALPGVSWAEVDQTLTIADRSAPPGTASAAPNASKATSISIAASNAPSRPGTAPAAPPSSCAPATGLANGTPNDPLHCNEPAGPYYAEGWNAFCSLPSTQSASVLAGAAAAPKASGICADGAWRLGARGQGTIVAILDSGVDYLHPDLRNRMVDETNDPLLSDPNFPGSSSDGHLHGWNFYDDNAEPMDFYGHGTGRAGIAAAEADNGLGGAGIAPQARIMAVKVGDTYVVHAENLAEGAVYAADHGADVINTSLGATGNSKLLRMAAVYAYTKGVVWAAATANEYSTHHNFPTDVDTVIGVGGLGPELAVPSAQTCAAVDPNTGARSQCAPASAQSTFLQKVGYANYGGIQTFAAPIDTVSTRAAVEACGGDPLPGGPCAGKGDWSLHNSGTSTATPHVTGAAAVVRSAGLTSGDCQGHLNIDNAFNPATCTAPALTANEVRQVLAYTANRVHNNDAPTANNYPATSPSGDPSLATGGEYYPEGGGDPHLHWNIWSGYGAPDLYAATAYVQAGLVPPEAQLFGDTPPPTPAFAGLAGPRMFGVYNPAATPWLPIVGHVAAPRLSTGQRLDWFVQVAPCLEPVEADFTTILSGTGTKDGRLGNWRLPTTLTAQCATTGVSRPFSPPGTYTLRVLSRIDDTVGHPIAVSNPVAATDPNYHSAPAPAPLIGQDRRVVYIRPHTAADHARSPYYLGASGEASPTLYDIEGRGQLDIIEPTADGSVVALRPNGTPVPGWPVATDNLSHLGTSPHPEAVDGVIPSGQIVGSVAVGDINGDGQPEVVAASFKGGVYAWHRDGSRVAGFPVQLPPPPKDANPPPGFNSNPGQDASYCAVSHPAAYAERFSDYGTIAAPVLADIEGRHDGSLDIVVASSNNCVYALRPNGSLAWSYYPNSTGSQPMKIADTPAVGSLNGDGKLDVVFGTEEVQGSVPNTSGRLYALDGATGTLLPGWPASLSSISAAGVPSVATGVISSPALLPSTAGGPGLQVAVGVFLGGDGAHPVTLINANGTQGTTFDASTAGAGSNVTDLPFHWGVTQTAVGHVGSSAVAVVTGGLGNQLISDTAGAPGKKPSFQHEVGAFDATTGAFVATFPRQIDDWQFLSGPVIADVKGDGTDQVITASGGGYLHAFDPAGTPAARSVISTSLSDYSDFSEPGPFPVFLGGGYVTSTPAVGQLTRNGPLTVVTVTRDGYLFLTDTGGQPGANDQWWKFHHDERNSGLFGLDTRPPATVTDLVARHGSQSGSARLRWTEVGDNWWVGQVGSVDLRWSTSPITDSNFSAATPVAVPTPVASGATETVTVTGLPSGVPIYFAERGVDQAGNVALIARTVLGAA